MALKWFKNQLAENYSFREIDEIAKEIETRINLLPYFCGSMPKYNPNATATFSGINLTHTRAHFARAIMEAIAFTLKQNIEYVGVSSADEIRITGGGASSRLWSTIKSDVTGKVLKNLTESETACLGTAIASAVDIGDFASLEEAVNSIVKTKDVYTPTGADYTEAYRKYIELDKTLILI